MIRATMRVKEVLGFLRGQWRSSSTTESAGGCRKDKLVDVEGDLAVLLAIFEEAPEI